MYSTWKGVDWFKLAIEVVTTRSVHKMTRTTSNRALGHAVHQKSLGACKGTTRGSGRYGVDRERRMIDHLQRREKGRRWDVYPFLFRSTLRSVYAVQPTPTTTSHIANGSHESP